MNYGASNAEGVVVDYSFRLLAVGGTKNGARTSAQSAKAKASRPEPGTSTPSGLIPNRHSGLDAMKCDTANYVYALPANAGSAQPIAQ